MERRQNIASWINMLLIAGIGFLGKLEVNRTLGLLEKHSEALSQITLEIVKLQTRTETFVSKPDLARIDLLITELRLRVDHIELEIAKLKK